MNKPTKLKTPRPVPFKKPEWWNAFNLESLERYSDTARMLLDYAITSGQTVYSGSCKGVLEDAGEEHAFEEFVKALVDGVGGSTNFAHCPIFGRGETETWVLWANGSITIRVGLDKKITVSICTLSLESYQIVGGILGEYLLPENVRQPVYALAEGPTGTEIMEVGLAGEALERDNYEDEVLKGFDFIVSEFQREAPIGRLAIIYGDPGSGKTYMIRGFLEEVPDAIFVLIPSHLVESLAGPKLVPMLIRARSLAGTDSPIILVIEDADKALVIREEGSLAAISSLLNVSDGILGHTLNLRVICTTNAKIEHIDPALLRAGRLSLQINIGKLSTAKCTAIYERIMNGETVIFNEEQPLAEVYRFANTESYADSDEDTDESEDEDEDDDETLDGDDDEDEDEEE
jgi:hypothetical protein